MKVIRYCRREQTNNQNMFGSGSLSEYVFYNEIRYYNQVIFILWNILLFAKVGNRTKINIS